MGDLIILSLTRGEVLNVMHAVAMEYNRRGDEKVAELYDKIKARRRKGRGTL